MAGKMFSEFLFYNKLLNNIQYQRDWIIYSMYYETYEYTVFISMFILFSKNLTTLIKINAFVKKKKVIFFPKIIPQKKLYNLIIPFS